MISTVLTYRISATSPQTRASSAMNDVRVRSTLEPYGEEDCRQKRVTQQTAQRQRARKAERPKIGGVAE